MVKRFTLVWKTFKIGKPRNFIILDFIACYIVYTLSKVDPLNMRIINDMFIYLLFLTERQFYINFIWP